MNKRLEKNGLSDLSHQDGGICFIHPLFGDHMVLQQGGKTPIWGWSKPGNKVSVTFAGCQESAVADETGRWMVHFQELSAGGPHEMHVMDDGGNARYFKDVYVGEVWLCSGQSNMDQRLAKGRFYWCGVENEKAEIAASDHPMIRHYAVRVQLADEPCLLPADAKRQHPDPKCPPNHGKWTICSPTTSGNYSATAYFFARELQQHVKVPIGLIQCCYGASTAQAWISKAALGANPRLSHFHPQYELLCSEYFSGECLIKYERLLKDWVETEAGNLRRRIVLPRHQRRKPKFPHDPRLDQHSPSVMYNGMVAPLVPYAMRGVIWYHGESNQPTANLYFEMLQTLITDWRSAWGEPVPFLIVQLHNMNEPNTIPIERQRIPIIREGQLQALKINGTAVVVSIDLGEAEFHVKNKQPLGQRLALAARGLVYGDTVIYSGPLYSQMTIEAAKARIHFAHASGLYSKGNSSAFIIAGKSGNFQWANAEIEGDTVVVSHPAVTEPVAVRYAWAENPGATLYNRFHLPASPFRTDFNVDARNDT